MKTGFTGMKEMKEVKQQNHFDGIQHGSRSINIPEAIRDLFGESSFKGSPIYSKITSAGAV